MGPGRKEAYDVIIVGGGHAGCEAAAAAANMGSKVLMITMSMTNMAQMSCNPSIGGVAKGQIVREIDAMGGYTGIVSDNTMIQFRMLNLSKGPAMWSPRAQNDRVLFSIEWREILEKLINLDFWQDTVTEIIVKGGRAIGVKTKLGLELFSKTVVLSNGTFLNGLIHIGTRQLSGGRIGERPAKNLTENLNALGIKSSRMKTGTPARVDGRTLDFSRMTEQEGDKVPGKFSYTETKKLEKQKSCYLTYTNPEVHDILKEGFERSPLFTGRIKGRGPRYCPSIEDKIERFATKNQHQLFIEPEGWNTVEFYINGFSSSLPEEIQFRALRKVPGFEHAKFFRPGYAVEYDYFPPSQLNFNLETKAIENLFFAGQINGTTGYEEAAAQGFMAGINAHLKIRKKPAFILKRSEAYIGVLIDDLITKGTEEPYRMFTSRAEYRILLRQDNADYRLTEKSYNIGLATEERILKVRSKYEKIRKIEKALKNESITPGEINPYLQIHDLPLIRQKNKIETLIQRPQIKLMDLYSQVEKLRNVIDCIGNVCCEEIEEAELLIKYKSYIEKEKEVAEKLGKFEDFMIPKQINYNSILSLSFEAREKLSKIRPETIGQASRISGVSPSDVSVLIVYVRK
ncbi:MAG: tRNA uridine-5-carboxymethylaminomethyl(34) synthesis enzyme MnmG [Bacteroidetes bacterium]|nr:tRNA uridine-5-carboxymethylaminomethyl(34) synthesis enzyme MnmG [Bacteroidota bacterium]